MKRLKLLAVALTLIAGAAVAGSNYVIPGARQDGWQGVVQQQAVQTGTTASGDPVMTPVFAVSGGAAVSGTASLTGTNITSSGTYTFVGGALQQQFIFTSGTTVLNGMTYTAGTQWNAPMTKVYPVTTLVVTGASPSINVQIWY